MRETTSKLKAIVSMLMLLAVFAFSAVFMTACNSECQHENLQKHDANAATCSAEGNSEYWACPDCDKIFADEGAQEELSAVPTIDALGHEWEETWQNDGNGHWHKCRNCDTLSSSDPHTVVAIGEAKSSTCTEAGITAGEKCSVCGYVIEAQTATPALGHELDHVEAKTATCSSVGNIEYWHCERCDGYFKDSAATQSCTQADTVIAINSDAHTFGELQSAKEATCTEAGNVEYKDCELCGKHFSSDGTELEEVTIAALGHNYNAITIATQPANLVYIVGEDFSAEGMVVQATCARDGCGTTTTISDYTLAGAEELTKGEKTVTVTWNDLTATVDVTVYEEHDYSSQGSYADFEYAANQALTATMKGGLSGTAFALSCNGEEYNEGVTVSGTSLTLSESVVSGLLGEKTYGDFTVTLYTDTYDMYVMNISIVTKIIDEAQDLADITAANTTTLVDAYYIVTADIDASSVGNVLFVNSPKTTFSSVADKSAVGFKGIFDGRGHTISNISTYGDYARLGGLFGQLMEGSVVKNVAFVNVSSYGDQGMALVGESSLLLGTIENVVVVAAEDGGCTRVVANLTGGVMKNCLFVGFATINNDGDQTQVTNVMSVTTNADYYDYGGFRTSNVVAAYAAQPNYSGVNAMFAALAADNKLTDWGSVTYASGAISFNGKVILKPAVNVSFDNENGEIQRGTSLTFTTDGYVTLSLETAVGGVSVEGNVLTVAGMVAEDTQITVVATSTLNESVTAGYTFTVIRSYTDVTLDGEFDFSLEGESSSVTVTLEGDIERIAAGTAQITDGITYNSGMLTLTKNALTTLLNGSAYAEDLTLNIYTSADKKYIATVNIATMFIDIADDLTAITAANTSNLIDAYYIVTEDIDASSIGAVSFVNSLETVIGTDKTIGFKGIFDGRGHTISNISTYSRYNRLSGLFGQLVEGSVVKNIAFSGVKMLQYNGTEETQGVVLVGESSYFNGTIENVVVVAAENGNCQYVVSRLDSSGIMRNCLFVGFASVNKTKTASSVVSNVMSVTTVVSDGGFNATTEYAAQPNYASVNEMFTALATDNLLTNWGDITYADESIKFNGKVILTASAAEETTSEGIA